MNKIDQLAKVAYGSRHFYKSQHKYTYCDKKLEKHDPVLNQIGLSKYTMGEIVHTFEKAYADFWERRGRKAKDPNTQKYLDKFFESYKTPEAYK